MIIMPDMMSSEVVTSAAVHCKHYYHIPYTWQFTGTDTTLLEYNWASVSEPHTCDFNATFPLYVVYICDRHCTSNIAINISIFHLGLIRGARTYCPDAVRPHPLLKPLPTGAEL